MQGQLQDKGYYPEGRLYVTKTTDENGNESYEFKNIAGNVILKRTICSIDEAADTYYIYDYRGNLAFVLPPNKSEAHNSLSNHYSPKAIHLHKDHHNSGGRKFLNH